MKQHEAVRLSSRYRAPESPTCSIEIWLRRCILSVRATPKSAKQNASRESRSKGLGIDRSTCCPAVLLYQSRPLFGGPWQECFTAPGIIDYRSESDVLVPSPSVKNSVEEAPAAGQDGQGGGRPSELQTKLNPPRGAKTQTAGGGGDNQAPRGCLGACNAEPRSPSQPASHPLTLARRVVGQEGVRVRACVCVCVKARCRTCKTCIHPRS